MFLYQVPQVSVDSLPLFFSEVMNYLIQCKKFCRSCIKLFRSVQQLIRVTYLCLRLLLCSPYLCCLSKQVIICRLYWEWPLRQAQKWYGRAQIRGWARGGMGAILIQKYS